MAEKLPSGNYRVNVSYLDNYGKKRRKSFTAETAIKAEMLAEQFKTNLEDTINNPTVDYAVKEYIELNEVVLSPSTIRAYRAYYRSNYMPISNTRLKDLSAHVLQRWMNWLASEKSPKTCRNAWWLLKSSLKLQGITVKDVKLPQKRKGSVQIPQTEDVQLLLELSKDTELYPCILLGAFCGLRRSEISALTWEDFNFVIKTVNIVKSMVYGTNGWEIKPPKSLSGYRTMDLPDVVYDYFSNLHTEKPITLNPNAITERFHKLCKDNGMDYHFHLLRHYYASVCCAQGIPEAYTVLFMGHSTYDMVKNVYGHVLNDAERKARRKMVEYFNKTTHDAHGSTHDMP